MLELEAQAERFADLSDENNETYKAKFTADIIGNSQWSFPVSLLHEKGVRDRTRPLTTQTANERLDVSYTTASAGVRRQFNRLNLSLLGNYESLRNDDGIGLDGQTRVVFSDKDRETYGATLGLTYEFPRHAFSEFAEHNLFTNFTYAENKLKRRQFLGNSFSGPLASFTEYGFLSGFETTYKGLIFANIGLGATQQLYDDAALNDVKTFNVSARVNYNLTPKSTLNFNALRIVDPDNGLAQGVITSDYGIGADYELKHNLFTGVDLGYTNFDFDEIGRTDDDYHGSAYLRYHHGKNIESMIELNYQNRQSTEIERGFDRLGLMFRLTGKI